MVIWNNSSMQITEILWVIDEYSTNKKAVCKSKDSQTAFNIFTQKLFKLFVYTESKKFE
jgi:hypothetical protein